MLGRSRTKTPALVLLFLCAPCRPFQHEPADGPARLPSPTLPARETLQYTIEWRLITAGKARLSWDALPESSNGWHANLHLESSGLVSKLYKVEDDYRSVLTPELCTLSSRLKAHEGGRRRETDITFDYHAKKASYLERDLNKSAVVRSQEIDIPGCVHDVVSGLYFLRTLDLKPGESARLPVSDGKKSVLAKVEALRKENVKTPSGLHKAVKYEVFLFSNVLYRRPGKLYVWLTDDARKLPVQIQVRLQFRIGTITLQLAKEERT